MSRKIDFGGREWSAHAQDHWLEFAGNPHFPDYLRVTFVAYGRHAANGHAKLEREELARFLVRTNGVIPDHRSVWSSVQKAIRLGYLAEDSNALCLVVSSHVVQGGVGDPDRRCTRDHTKRQKRGGFAARDDKGRAVPTGSVEASVGADDRHSATSVGHDAGHSETSVGADDRHSTLRPSLSSTPVRQDRNDPDHERTLT